jgi:hypothetical protein
MDPEWEGYYFYHSVPVLVVAGKRIYHAYCKKDEPEDPVRWYIEGRDGYGIDGLVTHWQPLPELPNELQS